MASVDQTFDPRVILAALERSYVNYVLIGGLARTLRGADEITAGVDVCPSLTSENIHRLERAVDELGARRADRRPLELSEQALSGEPLISLSSHAGTLNLVAAPAGAPNGYADLRRAGTKEHLGHGLEPLVASIGDLARMAAALHRERDIARLPELRRIMELEADRHQTLARPPGHSRPLTPDPAAQRRGLTR